MEKHQCSTNLTTCLSTIITVNQINEPTSVCVVFKTIVGFCGYWNVGRRGEGLSFIMPARFIAGPEFREEAVFAAYRVPTVPVCSRQLCSLFLRNRRKKTRFQIRRRCFDNCVCLKGCIFNVNYVFDFSSNWKYITNHHIVRFFLRLFLTKSNRDLAKFAIWSACKFKDTI